MHVVDLAILDKVADRGHHVLAHQWAPFQPAAHAQAQADRPYGCRSERGPPPPRAPFFFQAEDGIRGADVTGVKTCALPILRPDDQIEFARTAYEEGTDFTVAVEEEF